jgi:hypothetical protein
MWLESKWMQLEDIMLRLARLRNTQVECFLSYMEDRSKDKHIYKNKHDHIQTHM